MNHVLVPRITIEYAKKPGALHGQAACAAHAQRETLREQLRFCRHAALMWPFAAEYWRKRAREKIAKLRALDSKTGARA